jgi:hypothetical protein
MGYNPNPVGGETEGGVIVDVCADGEDPAPKNIVLP